MFYQVLSNITIQQIPSAEFPYRDMVIHIPFLHSYEEEGTWADLTQTITLTLPKNVRVRVTSETRPSMNSWINLGNAKGLYGNLGGFTPGQAPTLLAGDRITMDVGYRGWPKGIEETYMTGVDLSKSGGLAIPHLFKGFISQVNTKLPFTIECEDNMWLLKQMPTPSKHWGKGSVPGISGAPSVQDIVNNLISASLSNEIIKRYEKYGGVNLSVSKFSITDLTFNVSNFITQGESITALLLRMKRQYRMDSYFRGDELRIGLTHYVPDDVVRHSFKFQRNIISDRLIWKRRDDHKISMLVNSHYVKQLDTTNADGTQKTKSASTHILVYYNQVKGDFDYIEKKKGVDLPIENKSVAGETHTLTINSDIADAKRLFEIAKPQIKNYYYDGFKGHFETFGIPYVKHGDEVEITDDMLPERNGVYKVKKVNHYGGVRTGLRQRIEIDYLIPEA